jgi:glycosyltransferase involved in cell wall biosynthesis
MFPHPDAPGDSPFILEQVKALRREGVDARVMSGRAFPLYLRRPLGIPGRWRAFRHAWNNLHWSVFDGVPVLYVPHHVGWVARILRLDDPYRDAMVRGGNWMRATFDYDLIHAHTAHPDGFAAWALAQEHDKPLIITEHTGPFSSLTAEPTLRAKTLKALGAARRVWCVSDSLTREVASYFPVENQGHIQTLYNGVDTTLFSPPSSWRPDPAAPRLLFVGLLEPIKNVPILIEAFAALRGAVPGARLGIVGYGSLQKQVEQQIAQLKLENAITLLGGLDRVKLASLMRNWCDILVLPSKSETFGVVLIEALATGKPVVASRCGGPESIVTHADFGALCTPNDATALARCLEETVARLPSFRSERIRTYVVEKFDYGTLARKLKECYSSVSGRECDVRRVSA